jgi:RNA polymerase sigma factor (sigma-70 family)
LEWLAKPEVRKVLVSIAYYRLGLSGEDIDELIQDFYKDKLFPVARAYAPERDDFALVRTAFWKFGLNWLRNRRTQGVNRHLSFDDPDRSVTLHRETAVQPFLDHLQPDERVDALRRAKSRLTDVDRRYVQLAHFEHRSNAEVAAALGLTVGAVKVGIHRAKARLRALVIDEGFCVCVEHVLSWPGLAKQLAFGLATPQTPIGAFCLLLPAEVGDAIQKTNDYGPARRLVVNSFNSVLRGRDLDSVVDGSAQMAMAVLSTGTDVLGRIQRNRLIVEDLFDPHLLRTAKPAERQ